MLLQENKVDAVAAEYSRCCCSRIEGACRTVRDCYSMWRALLQKVEGSFADREGVRDSERAREKEGSAAKYRRLCCRRRGM